MPVWLWVIIIIAAVLTLLLFLFRVRYRADWNGASEWSAAVEFGIPGLMRGVCFPEKKPSSETSAETRSTSEQPQTAPKKTATQSGASPKTSPSKPSFTNRARRALFAFITNGAVLGALTTYALRFTGRLFRLLNLELDASLSLSNPATLGRVAGYWYAVKPLLGKRRVNFEFRFQDSHFALKYRLRGGFTLARALGYASLALVSFPWLTLLHKAWQSWRRPGLSGWRNWIYNRIQKSPRIRGIS